LCARHERRPRVEFFAELWPGLAAALAAAGFAVEAEAPVLVAEAPPPPDYPPAGIAVERLGPATPRPMLQACLEAAAATFHEPAAILAPGELERLQEGLAGGAVRSAVVLAGGAPVSGASLAGRGPVAELLGVWTAPAHRRRGLARAVCRDLLSGFFRAGGELAWLAASGEASRSLYEGLGFRACGTHLDCADLRPAAAPPARP
jgi:GNAT superfamily N-acetyltransferase